MSEFAYGDRVRVRTDLGSQSIRAGAVFSVTAVSGEYVQIGGREGWYHSVRFERVGPPVEANEGEPLILGDDGEPTKCLDEAGCEVGPDVIDAIEHSEEKWQAIDVDGVTHLVVGATFAVALRDGCDRRNIDALVRRLNQPIRVNLRISDVGPEGLGPITAGFVD